MDTMQFVRELLEGQQPGSAIRGVVTHAIKVPTEDPTDPNLYDLQVEVQGYTYTCMAFTRDPNIPAMIPMGLEVLISKPSPGTEGYPTYLYLVRAPSVAMQQMPQPQMPSPMQQQPYPQPQHVPMAPPPYPNQAAGPVVAPPQQLQQFDTSSPVPQHGVQNYPSQQWDPPQPEQQFNPNVNDAGRMPIQPGFIQR